MPQLEGPATKIYNYVPGGFGEIKQGGKKRKIKDWQQLLAQVPIFKEKKKIGEEGIIIMFSCPELKVWGAFQLMIKKASVLH